MSETSVSVPAKAVVKAATKSTVDSAAQHLNAVLPTVVETTDIALELPSKVVVNQRLVVIVGVVGGAVLGAGVLYAVNKWRDRSAKKKAEKDLDDIVAVVENTKA